MVMPCAGCIAAFCTSWSVSRGATLWFPVPPGPDCCATWSDIMFFSSTSVAPTAGPRGEPCPDREVCVEGAADLLEQRDSRRTFHGGAGVFSRSATPAQQRGG